LNVSGAVVRPCVGIAAASRVFVSRLVGLCQKCRKAVRAFIQNVFRLWCQGSNGVAVVRVVASARRSLGCGEAGPSQALVPAGCDLRWLKILLDSAISASGAPHVARFPRRAPYAHLVLTHRFGNLITSCKNERMSAPKDCTLTTSQAPMIGKLFPEIASFPARSKAGSAPSPKSANQ
jgi:hypothetical protein